MATYYFCFDNDIYVQSYDDTKKTTYDFNVKFGDETVNINQQYKHNATYLSRFKGDTTRFICGNRNIEKVEVYGQILSSSPYGTYDNFVDITNLFDIKTYNNSIIDITPNNQFNYGQGSYIMMYIAINKNFVATSYLVSEELQNIKSDKSNPKRVDINSNFTLNYQTEGNYTIDEINANIGTVSLAEDKKSATIKGKATKNIKVTGKATEKVFVLITGTFENCTCNYIDNEIFTKDKPIIITPKPNYEFTEHYSYRDGAITHQLTVNNEGLLVIKNVGGYGNIKLNDNYIATPKVEKISSMANIYHVTDTELRELSHIRFIGSSVDYGNFITSLYMLPFELDNELYPNKSKIILGNYDSDVKADTLKTYNIGVEFGRIEIPQKYNNVYDFINTVCNLYIPFFGNVYLDTDYVIGQTITLNVIIDLYSGNAICEVISSFTGQTIQTINKKIGLDIPYMQKQNNSSIGGIGNILNTLNRAYIEVKRNKPYYVKDSIFGEMVKEEKILNECTGYVEIEKINLVSNATNEEQQEIKSILNSGVFINER